jgi:molybdopterin converting factor small subunit
MLVPVHFWSWFKDVAGGADAQFEVPAGTTIEGLLAQIYSRFPKLAAARNSTLIAVGIEYQGPAYALQPGDEVSLFPPVQGG